MGGKDGTSGMVDVTTHRGAGHRYLSNDVTTKSKIEQRLERRRFRHS